MRRGATSIRVGFALGLSGILIASLPAGARSGGKDRLIDPLRITFFPLERGDATLIQVPGKNILVGGGAAGEGDKVIAFLAARGIKKLDIAMVQTWKDRHFGGLPVICKKMGASLVLTNAQYAPTKTASALAQYVDYTTRSGKTYMRSTGVGESLSLSYNPICQLRVYSPIAAMLAETAPDPDSSMVMEFSREQTSFLDLGDTHLKHQKRLWAAAETKPWGQILAIRRNGAADALLTSLLKPLKTRIAVIPVAKKAGPGPAPALLSALSKAGVRVYRTDLNGTITVSTDGRSYQVKTDR